MMLSPSALSAHYPPVLSADGSGSNEPWTALHPLPLPGCVCVPELLPGVGVQVHLGSRHPQLHPGAAPTDLSLCPPRPSVPAPRHQSSLVSFIPWSRSRLCIKMHHSRAHFSSSLLCLLFAPGAADQHALRRGHVAGACSDGPRLALLRLARIAATPLQKTHQRQLSLLNLLREVACLAVFPRPAQGVPCAFVAAAAARRGGAGGPEGPCPVATHGARLWRHSGARCPRALCGGRSPVLGAFRLLKQSRELT